jgi:hypothetical protein
MGFQYSLLESLQSPGLFLESLQEKRDDPKMDMEVQG